MAGLARVIESAKYAAWLLAFGICGEACPVIYLCAMSVQTYFLNVPSALKQQLKFATLMDIRSAKITQSVVDFANHGVVNETA